MKILKTLMVASYILFGVAFFIGSIKMMIMFGILLLFFQNEFNNK